LLAFHELLGRAQNFSKKMIAGPNFLSELGPRVGSHVDLSAEMGLDLPERRRELREPDSADDQQVDVACGMLLTARDGSVNEGDVNLCVKLLQ
jgi:hypothetical protein